jgi:hypothetical protein
MPIEPITLKEFYRLRPSHAEDVFHFFELAEYATPDRSKIGIVFKRPSHPMCYLMFARREDQAYQCVSTGTGMHTVEDAERDLASLMG